MNKEQFFALARELGFASRIEENVKMSEHTTFKIGGEARFAVYPETSLEVETAVKLCEKAGLSYYVVGKGSNLLVDDEGYDGVVIFTTSLDKVEFRDNEIYVGAGAGLTSLAREAAERGLGGLEFACGIPGTVGGAVYMNAGAYDGEMKDCTVKSEFYSKTEGFGELEGEEQKFSYRSSAYTNTDRIILGCTIRLEKTDRAASLGKCQDLLSRRREKQPLEYPSAGSTFKRYPGRFTGKMIEDAGLKGFRVGGASVSEKHAGFIVNDNRATSSDVIELISAVKEKILSAEGVEIECEVKYLSRNGEKKI
jgi:UDP-N-acetylmuramate dehydrogenase